MSDAPRIIYAQPDHGNYSNATWSDGGGVWSDEYMAISEEPYHHDDVVQEMIAALRDACKVKLDPGNPDILFLQDARVIIARLDANDPPYKADAPTDQTPLP